jgi:hypothetical protein
MVIGAFKTKSPFDCHALIFANPTHPYFVRRQITIHDVVAVDSLIASERIKAAALASVVEPPFSQKKIDQSPSLCMTRP